MDSVQDYLIQQQLMQQLMQCPIEINKGLLIRFLFSIRTKFLASFDHVLNGWRSKNVPKLRPAKTADEEK